MLGESIDSRHLGIRTMQNNLFAPPRAVVADAKPPGSEVAKPTAVWLGPQARRRTAAL